MRSRQELNEKEQLLLLVNKCASKLGIPFLVVGAAARDLLIDQQDQKISLSASTFDVDVGCRVYDWTAYNNLCACLLEQEEMLKDTGMVHRLLFRGRIPLDLLPFGMIAGDSQSITWSEHADISFNVAGFEEAYQSSISVYIGDEKFSVASFAAIAWLKLSAWHDNKTRTKDLSDLWYIIDNYLEFVPKERIYAEDGKDRDIFDDEKFSTVRAGARLLGRDMVRQGGEIAKGIVGRVMDRNGEPCDAIVQAMTAVVPSFIGASEIVDMFATLGSEVCTTSVNFGTDRIE